MDKLKEYLKKLDQGGQPPISFHGEHDIAQKIRNILSEEKEYEPTKEDMAEQMAFDFMADYPNDNSGWETYHGPLSVMPNKDGQMVEYPSIKRINKEMLEYWAKRARESKNPILSSRYADLVVDFSSKVLNKNTDIELFHIVIDSNITICERYLADPLDCIAKIKRALDLAIYKHDQERINKTKDTIIKLEKDVAIDDKPGLWGFAFKWLLLDFAKKVTLDEKERKILVKEIEKRLERVKQNPWLAENAVSLLAEYYANEKDEENLMRVLDILENSLKANEHSNSDALLKTHAYEQIHEIYRKYANRFTEAEKANKRILQEIGQLDLDWNKSLKEISVETKIKQEDIDNFLKNIFGESKNDELGMIMAKIAVNHLPKVDDVQRRFDKIYSKSITNLIATQQILSEDKIPIARLSTIADEPDNHFKNHAFQYIQFGSFFLSLTMVELKKQFTKEKIIEYFEKSVIFENENKDYLKRAISAYWDNDYLISSHLFNPLIESGIRELMKISNGVWLEANTINGYDKLTLSKLLWNEKNVEIIKNIFSKSGQDLLFYLKLVLIEKLGMNLRNDFAHGFGKNKFFGRDASDRLFHILVWLSVVKKKS